MFEEILWQASVRITSALDQESNPWISRTKHNAPQCSVWVYLKGELEVQLFMRLHVRIMWKESFECKRVNEYM